MAFQETDRVPLYDIIDNDAIRVHYCGEEMTPENCWPAEYKAIRILLDMTRSPMAPNFSPGQYVTEDGFTYYNARDTSWLEKRPFDDTDGLAAYIMKDIDRARKWQPDAAYIEAEHKRARDIIEAIGDDTVLVLESDVGLDQARTKAGIELLSYISVDEPELVSEWLEALNEAEIRKAHAIADKELLPVMLTYTDLACKSGPIFSPEFYRKEFFPRLKKLNNAYQEHGVKCLFHSDGNLMSIMDDLVAADIDGINPIETMAGMSIGEVRRRWPKIFITGGVDVSQLMVYGTPDEVRERCKKAIDESCGVGYFLGSTTELHPAVKAENILAMLEVGHSYKP